MTPSIKKTPPGLHSLPLQAVALAMRMPAPIPAGMPPQMPMRRFVLRTASEQHSEGAAR